MHHLFPVFMVLALALLVALALQLLFPKFLAGLLENTGSAALGVLGLLRRRIVVLGLVTAAVIGLFVERPAMFRDGFTPTEANGATRQQIDSAPPAEASPGSMPPLDYEIKVADCILTAQTEVQGSVVTYQPEDVWKAPEDCTRVAGEFELTPDISSFRLLGYEPEQGQEVVLFFTPGRDGVSQLLDLLPVTDGELTYAPDDSSVKRRLKLDEFRQLVVHPHAVKG